jgi:hypothetical protein
MLTASNSGLTTPVSDAAGGSIYTDSFNISVGTSFRHRWWPAPCADAVSRSDLTPARVRSRLQSGARPFPSSG